MIVQKLSLTNLADLDSTDFAVPNEKGGKYIVFLCLSELFFLELYLFPVG